MIDMREFDIVVWGATGWVGQRVAQHLASRYGSAGPVRWAMAGRNEGKLESVRSAFGPPAPDVDILLADSHDRASLRALVERTRVVCSTVGPFAKYGSELVEACAHSGTHYCDISAEVHWIRRMIDLHSAEAERTGARIVHACGFDSIPSDLGVLFLQRAARNRRGKPCPRIRMRVRSMHGALNGGTAATFLYTTQEAPRDPDIGRVMTEPYSLNPEGHRHGPDLPESIRDIRVEYDDELAGWTMPFAMAPMNTKIVRRTNALSGYPYGEGFSYGEAMLAGAGFRGRIKAVVGALASGGFMRALRWAPTRWLLGTLVLPKPGEGPNESVREGGSFDLIFVGRRADGKVLSARVTGQGDPNTEATSRLAFEAAVCLAEDEDRIAVGGGSWTPVSSMGDLLLSRIAEDGVMSFELEPSATATQAPATSA
jgi:short subunit dehydrogenase-like uncharacterized protein